MHEFKQHGDHALARFNDLNGNFVRDDLYVFVLDMDTQVVRAHGGMPRLINRPAGELIDANGKPFIRDLIKAARASDEGRVEYAWRNPLTQKMERKQTWFVRVGHRYRPASACRCRTDGTCCKLRRGSPAWCHGCGSRCRRRK